MNEGSPTRLTVVAGLDRRSAALVCDRMLHAEPDVVVVHHDLRLLGEGVVRRSVRRLGPDGRPVEETAVLELAHGCVSCTLRGDVLPLVRTLAGRAGRRVVLHLDPVMEPEAVCWTLQQVPVDGVLVTDVLDLDAVVTVVDEDTFLADVVSETDLADLTDREFGLPPGEERTLGRLAVALVEFADAVVVRRPAPDRWTAARVTAVLDRLAPGAPRVRFDPDGTAPGGAAFDPAALLAAVPPTARRGHVLGAHEPLLRGEPPLDEDCGVALTVFVDRRPFHPQRLHDAIDVLIDGVVRAWGRAWVASQPDVALWLDAAGGGLRVGHAGAWLAAADDGAWDRADPERRTRAALDWHPRYGDRTQELAVLTHDASPAAVTAALRGALLTEAEFAGGTASWQAYPDPFASWRTEPDETPYPG